MALQGRKSTERSAERSSMFLCKALLTLLAPEWCSQPGLLEAEFVTSLVLHRQTPEFHAVSELRLVFSSEGYSWPIRSSNPEALQEARSKTDPWSEGLGLVMRASLLKNGVRFLPNPATCTANARATSN